MRQLLLSISLFFTPLVLANTSPENIGNCSGTFKESYFRLPSGSMMPLLKAGSYIGVKEWGGNARRECKHLVRGMLYMFSNPNNPNEKYVKRLIGLPGDLIAYKDRTLTINGKIIHRTFLKDWSYGKGRYKVYLEIIEGIKVETLVDIGKKVKSATYSFERKVKKGKYLFIGDNRDNSKDSRFIGDIPMKNIIGEVNEYTE